MKELKLLCWNVNGIRSVLRKGFLDFLKRESPDILCLQEVKAHPDQISEELKQVQGYHLYWNQPERKGYAGVGTFSKEEPLKVEYAFPAPKNPDLEGRQIITTYPEFTLFNGYFPNGKQGPERLQYKMDYYDAFLEYADGLRAKGEKLIICGDVNTAHNEIDLARPKANAKLSGFLPIERAWMDKLVSHGYVDTFRHFHKEPGYYSYWDIKTAARERNVGWRIDYFFMSEDLLPSMTGSFIMTEVMGSDHCPIGLTLQL